jgi:hypothetical protein
MPRVPDRRTAGLDRAAVRAEMEQARLEFRRLSEHATAADLRKPSDGTRWTNEQLLFHMLPDSASKTFARLLDSARRPFDLINYLSSCAGARIIPARCRTRMLDRTIAALQRHMAQETATALSRGMHYPATWDRFFAE